jgi:hypothetical protein
MGDSPSTYFFVGITQICDLYHQANNRGYATPKNSTTLPHQIIQPEKEERLCEKGDR